MRISDWSSDVCSSDLAAKAEIRDNSFDDTGGRETNYMIDLPEGATGLITANQMVQGKNKENYSAFIALAAEGKKTRSSGLYISGNRAAFAPAVSRTSDLVAAWGGDRIALGQNVLGQCLARDSPVWGEGGK